MSGVAERRAVVSPASGRSVQGTSDTTAAATWMPHLDAVRAVAVAAVVVRHFAPAATPAAERLVYLGSLGVPLFFCLSGFLVTGILLDARASSDWVLGHIPGAVPFPFYSVDELASNLPTDGTWIVAYCACPHAASGRVVDDLRARGFANTAVLDEGIYFWRDAGYPMARGRLP